MIPSHLTDADLRDIGERLDAIQARERASLGAADRAYILRLIRVQRWMALGGRALIFASLLGLPVALGSWPLFWVLISLGTLTLALSKILENMEIGHNVIHGQWDWMNDPDIHSANWEWDHGCPARQWKHTHNVVHHTWTNVLGMDRDIGYGMMRVTEHQRWHPFYLFQPLWIVLMAMYFEWFIALHDLEIPRVLKGKRDKAEARAILRESGAKVGRQALKDYLLWPLLAGPFFFIVLGANFTANVLRNIWTWAVIFCGHFPDGVSHFSKSVVATESRGGWYVRQMLGSCNIRGGRLVHILTGNLSHQIEHHLFPDLPSNRYARVAPEVEALCREYGLAYNSHSFGRQLGSVLWKLLRLTFPGGKRPSRRAAAAG